MAEKLKAVFRSRRFYASVAAIVALVLDGVGFPLPIENIEMLVGAVAAWVISDGLRETS